MLTEGDRSIAELTTRSTQHAVLNDAVNTVSDSGPAGQDYVLTATVRTTEPNVSGALRAREVTEDGAQSYQSSFWLTDEEWQTVQLELTTTRDNAALDVNVVAWNLRTGANLQVEDVSVIPVSGSTPGQGPEPDPGTAPNECNGAPPDRTEFGASVYTVGMTTAEAINQLDQEFGEVPALRIFSADLPRAWDHDQAEFYLGRTLVTSFRPPPSEINSGQHDDYFREWFANAPDDQLIYWSYFHEPEPRIRDGVFTEAEYKQAWSRLAGLADEACNSNLFATLVLTGWTAQPEAERELSTYDAGPDVIDVIAFDPYNGIYDPDRDYYISPEDKLGPIVEMMQSEGHDRPWAIAELGSRLIPGDSGAGRAQWLTDMGQYAIDNDAAFVTYFQSTRGANWRLDDTPSRAAWQELINDEQ